MPYAVCTVSAAPVRKEPGHRSEMTTQLLFGETMLLLEERDEWVKVRSIYDGYEGWVTHHLITGIDERAATAPGTFVTTGLVNALRFNAELFQIPMGCSLPGFTENTRSLWNGQYRYEGSYRNTTTPYTIELFKKAIVPWRNAPYLWGGKTFMGVDCSGFVQTVFKVLGVPLLRDAYQQAAQGTPVELEAGREGDVAFFENETGRITHVGIVLANGKIIHASGKVRVDDLRPEGIFTADGGKRTHRFHSIKRILDFAV